jgi:hypothetical protein
VAPLTRLAIVIGTTISGAVWLYYKGPVPVIRVTTPLPEIAPFWYMIIPFPILGMLIADLLAFYDMYGFDIRAIELGLQIGLILLLSYLRLARRLPVSGHSLLIAYFILRRIFIRVPSHIYRRVETVVAVLLFIAIIYRKLFWWYDPVTLFSGIAIAVVMIVISLYILRRGSFSIRPAQLTEY